MQGRLCWQGRSLRDAQTVYRQAQETRHQSTPWTRLCQLGSGACQAGFTGDGGHCVVEDSSGLCKAVLADDSALYGAPRGFQDTSAMCKAGFTDDDALRAVEDGSCMCRAGLLLTVLLMVFNTAVAGAKLGVLMTMHFVRASFSTGPRCQASWSRTDQDDSEAVKASEACFATCSREEHVKFWPRIAWSTRECTLRRRGHFELPCQAPAPRPNLEGKCSANQHVLGVPPPCTSLSAMQSSKIFTNSLPSECSCAASAAHSGSSSWLLNSRWRQALARSSLRAPSSAHAACPTEMLLLLHVIENSTPIANEGVDLDFPSFDPRTSILLQRPDELCRKT